MMRIAYALLWVHDQDEAVAFYTEKLGWEVRADVTVAELGNFRWLTVGPAGQPDVAVVLNAIPGPPVMDAETAGLLRTLMGKGFAGTVLLTSDDVQAAYEDLLSYWNTQPDSPFTGPLNAARKLVASRTLREPLPWPNSTLLDGDAVDAVADLKQQPGEDLHIMGSGELIQSLMRRGLIDEFMLMIHPLVLGSGRRLFADDSPATTLRLVDSKTATTGVVIATYQVQPANC